MSDDGDRAARVLEALRRHPGVLLELVRLLEGLPGVLGPWVDDDPDDGSANVCHRDDLVTGDEAVTVLRHGVAELYNVSVGDDYLEDVGGEANFATVEGAPDAEFATVEGAREAADAYLRGGGWVL